MKALVAGSRRPHHTQAAFSKPKAEQPKELLHKSPRAYGKETSLWTRELVAEVSFAEGLTEEWVSDETIRATLERLGIRWKRAKQWITSPDPEYQRKKVPRPADRSDEPACRLGDWLSRRNLAEPLHPAASTRLVAGWQAIAFGRVNPGQNGSSPKSAGLLWPAAAPLSRAGRAMAGETVAALCR